MQLTCHCRGSGLLFIVPENPELCQTRALVVNAGIGSQYGGDPVITRLVGDTWEWRKPGC